MLRAWTMSVPGDIGDGQNETRGPYGYTEYRTISRGIEGPSECLWITRPIQATGVVGLWLACVQVALRCCFTWATNKDPCSWIDPHGPRVYDGIMGIPSA